MFTEKLRILRDLTSKRIYRSCAGARAEKSVGGDGEMGGRGEGGGWRAEMAPWKTKRARRSSRGEITGQTRRTSQWGEFDEYGRARTPADGRMDVRAGTNVRRADRREPGRYGQSNRRSWANKSKGGEDKPLAAPRELGRAKREDRKRSDAFPSETVRGTAAEEDDPR